MPASRRRSISPPTQLRKAALGTQEFWIGIMSRLQGYPNIVDPSDQLSVQSPCSVRVPSV
jgi:hypothetical protein